jgi:hypothetical protein
LAKNKSPASRPWRITIAAGPGAWESFRPPGGGPALDLVFIGVWAGIDQRREGRRPLKPCDAASAKLLADRGTARSINSASSAYWT